MPRVFAASAIALLFSALAILSARAQRSEEGLLAVWEQAQKNDSSTVKFERVKDRQYHFATKHFPFDGDLLVRNVVIEDFSAVNQNGISMGTVEVELQGVTDDFHRTFARSYAQWNMSNTLYWDPKAQQWLTSEKYFQQVRTRIPTQAMWPALMGFGWLGILVLIFAFLFFSLWRYNSKIKAITQRSERTLQISERNGQIAERNAQIFEQSFKLQQENAKVFQEILAELKKLSARP
jgi:cell division protein FtsB